MVADDHWSLPYANRRKFFILAKSRNFPYKRLARMSHQWTWKLAFWTCIQILLAFSLEVYLVMPYVCLFLIWSRTFQKHTFAGMPAQSDAAIAAFTLTTAPETPDLGAIIQATGWSDISATSRLANCKPLTTKTLNLSQIKKPAGESLRAFLFGRSGRIWTDDHHTPRSLRSAFVSHWYL